jgi:putative addiction module component (TIGR02574 family)
MDPPWWAWGVSVAANSLAALAWQSENEAMSMPQEFFDTALSLPQSDRADLAFRLLQSLEQPGEEITSDEFGAELHDRLAAYRRGELKSYSLEETRAEIQKRLADRHSS